MAKKKKEEKGEALSITMTKDGVDIKGPGINYHGDGSLVSAVFELGASVVKGGAETAINAGVGATEMADKAIDKVDRVINVKKGE